MTLTRAVSLRARNVGRRYGADERPLIDLKSFGDSTNLATEMMALNVDIAFHLSADDKAAVAATDGCSVKTFEVSRPPLARVFPSLCSLFSIGLRARVREPERARGAPVPLSLARSRALARSLSPNLGRSATTT